MYNINLNALSVPPLIDNEMKWQSLNCVQLFGTPRTIVRQASLSMEFSSKNTGVGCHSLLQGIFPTQGSNPDLLHCRQILYCQYLFNLFGDPFSCMVPCISFEAECSGEKDNPCKYRIVIPPTTMQSIKNFFPQNFFIDDFLDFLFQFQFDLFSLGIPMSSTYLFFFFHLSYFFFHYGHFTHSTNMC